jgi:hypothetical protein
MPAAAPTSAQDVAIAPVRMSVDLFIWPILLGPGGRCGCAFNKDRGAS